MYGRGGEADGARGGVYVRLSVERDGGSWQVWITVHSVEFEEFVPSRFGGLRGQIGTTQGPKVNCVRQVDFQ